MGMESHDAVVVRVASISDYRRRFNAVFENQDITIDTIAKAIAAFERTQLSGNSPFDRFIAGDKSAISDGQRRGWELFQGKAKCITCHEFKPSSPFFTDFKFHNTGLATRKKNFEQLVQQLRLSSPTDATALNSFAHAEGFAELGRYLVTKEAKDLGAFKTPSLRDVELTAPFMHNGSEKTLFDVVKFYNRGGEANAYLDEKMGPLNLSYEEMNCLVEFLRALTSDDTLRQAQTLKPQTRTAIPITPH
jgi:cytochrome c peroxidase